MSARDLAVAVDDLLVLLTKIGVPVKWRDHYGYNKYMTWEILEDYALRVTR